MSDERGVTPPDDGDDFGLAELDGVLADLREVTLRPASPDVTSAHIAAMVAAAEADRRSAVAPIPLVVPVVPDHAVHPWRRRISVAVAAVAATLVGVGGLGAAGALPDPIQDAVATIAEPFGLDLPRSDDPPASQDVDTDGGAGSGEAPGRDGTAPGISGETPGQSGSEPPGQSGSAPGQSGSAPGQTGESPSVTAPGQSGESPSVTAPGQSGESPSVTAPGQSGQNPSATAPGQSGQNPSATAPGQSGQKPSATAPGQTTATA